ncbi:MAG: YggT family protein [Candidatus Gastranaerophilales bacterium]|nr:YggT family protein [Candidatus Gastranaerophilales bacterium]
MLAIKIVNNFFYFYYLLIILRIFLTWIPSIDWYQQPLKSIREITDIYLDIFRKFIPPISGLDISPIVALMVLSVIQALAVSVIATLVR